MVKVKHLILIAILFIICIVALVSFTHYNEEVDKKDYTNSYEQEINQKEPYNVSIANESYDNVESSLTVIKIEDLVFS